MTTPTIMIIRPKTFKPERISLKRNIPTKAVPAVPSPAHMLYATLSGINFREIINKVKEIPKPMTRAILGIKFVNPSDSLSIDVAKISNKMEVNKIK